MPLHSESSMSMMDCCDRAMSGDATSEANAARLCCAVYCSDPAPTAPADSQANFSPSSVTVIDSIAFQIARLAGTTNRSEHLVFRSSRPGIRQSQPKYIQHHSFLI